MSAMAVTETDRLELHEAVSRPASSPIRPDGLVPLHIIRPGIGKGRGNHLYEADMLQSEAGRGRFNGWKMYLDHLAPDAKKKAGGMPRSIRDLAGMIVESWWDASVPANPAAGHGQGAVVGLARVNRFMRALIEDLPEAVGASISAHATAVRPVTRNGQQVWLVEGIHPRGSVDWVTEAGAGGRVVSLMEAALEESWADEEAMELLEGRTDEEIVEVLREGGILDRPGIRAVLLEESGTKPTGHELEETHEGGNKVEVTELVEALQSDEGQTAIASAVSTAVTTQVEEALSKIVVPRLGELIEAALEDERELVQAEATATTSRRLEVRDLRDTAHKLIAESRLPEPFKVELRGKYELLEDGQPTAALDVVSDDPAKSDAPKSAEDKLAEAVAADLAVKEEQFLASRPAARVVGQGAGSKSEITEGAEGAEGGKKTEGSTGSPRTDHILQESGLDPGEDLWAGIPAVG